MSDPVGLDDLPGTRRAWRGRALDLAVVIAYAATPMRRAQHRERRLAATLVGVLALLAGAGCGAEVERAPAAAGGERAVLPATELVGRQETPVTVRYEAAPALFNVLPPCDPARYVPVIGVCRGTGWSSRPTVVSGDWEGQSEFQFGWVTTPERIAYASVVEIFTGTVKGCGAGSAFIRQLTTTDAQGNVDGEWEVVEGLGTGDLRRLRGAGVVVGREAPDHTRAGELRGGLYCGE